MPTCSPNEFVILNLIYRHTIGFNRSEVRLSYEQIKALTGIKSRTTISKALDGLGNKNYIIRRGERRGAMWYSCNQHLEIEVKSSPEYGLDGMGSDSELVQNMDQSSPEYGLDNSELVQNMDSFKRHDSKDKKHHDHDAAHLQGNFPPLDPDLGQAVSLYKNNIGPMNQLMADDFRDVYYGLSPPPGESRQMWVEYAILAASENEKNRWAYVKAIIRKIKDCGSLQKHKEDWNERNYTGSQQAFNGSSGKGSGKTTERSAYLETNQANIDAFEEKVIH